MKKIFILILTILSLISLFSCTMPIDKKTLDEKLILKISKDDMEVFYKDIKPINLESIVQNNYNQQYVIEWYVNDTLREKGNNFLFTPPNQDIYSYNIYFKAKFSIENQILTKKSPKITISVYGLDAQIKISEDNIFNNMIILDELTTTKKTINIEKITTKGYVLSKFINVYLLDEKTNTEKLLDKISINETKYTLKNIEKGNYRLYLKYDKEPNIQSNSINIVSLYYNININVNDSVVRLSLDNNVKSLIKNIKYHYIDKDNKNTIINDGLNYEFDTQNINLDGLVYSVITFNNNKIIETRKILIINNLVEVNTEKEFLDAIKNKTKKILINKDILITQTNTVVIDYPVSIKGVKNSNNKYSDIKSEHGIAVILEFRKNNNYILDLQISDSGKYNIKFTNSINNIIDNVVFNNPGNSTSITNPGAGIYIENSSLKVIKAEIVNSNNTGIRIEYYKNQNHQIDKSILDLTNSIFTVDDNLLIPIGSARSKKEDIEIIGQGIDMFILPLGTSSIIRYSTNGSLFKYEITSPNKYTYYDGEVLNLEGIEMKLTIGDSTMQLGLDSVYMLMNALNAKGLLEIKKLDNTTKVVAIIEGFDKNLGGDKIYYSYNDIKNSVLTINLEKGKYEIHISIGKDSNYLYLGKFEIEVAK